MKNITLLVAYPTNGTAYVNVYIRLPF